MLRLRKELNEMRDYIAGNRELEMKFTGIDILDAMGRIVDIHVRHYQSDFDIDRDIILGAAQEAERKRRTFLWLCRKCGTWCLNERNVFIRGTRENSTALYYEEQVSEELLAFIVEVAGLAGETVVGNFYPIAYRPYVRHIREKDVEAGSIILRYERGERTEKPDVYFDASQDREFGKFLSFEFQPASARELTEILWDERYRRDHYGEGSIRGYLDWLAVREMERYGYFWTGMVPISKKEAAKFMQSGDSPVFLLYQDGTEAEADSMDDIMRHDGMFGIERKEAVL